MTENRAKERSNLIFGILILILFMVSVVVIYQIYFVPGFKDIQQARMKISLLQQEIKKYQLDNEKLRARIKALRKNDPAAWEAATREYLGWVKPGEIPFEPETP